MNQENSLLLVWVTFTVVALAGVLAVFVWAVRSRQFSDQDRARYLPLVSGVPTDDDTDDDADRTECEPIRDKGPNHVSA